MVLERPMMPNFESLGVSPARQMAFRPTLTDGLAFLPFFHPRYFKKDQAFPKL